MTQKDLYVVKRTNEPTNLEGWYAIKQRNQTSHMCIRFDLKK